MTDTEALALIASIADYTARTKRNGLERDELISIGWIAYCRALETWEEGRGASLRTYIGQGVRLAIRGAARKGVPWGYRSGWGRPPEMDAGHDPIDEGPSPEDLQLYREIVDRVVDLLDMRSRTVVMMSMDGITHGEIGDELGLSRQRVQQICSEALAEIRAYFSNDGIS